jgi:TPR repeat protein
MSDIKQAERQARFRERRRSKGGIRVDMWLSEADAERLKQLAKWTGQSRPRSLLSALKSSWKRALQKAAEQDHVEAQLALAQSLRDKNRAEAQGWFRKAAAEGIITAKHNVALIDWSAGRQQQSVKDFEECAKSGLDVAQYNLALIYIDGTSVARNLQLAHKWLAASREQGFKQASIIEGLLRCAGHGVEQDYEAGLNQIRAAKGGSLTEVEEYIVQVLATDPSDKVRHAAGALLAARRLVKRRATAANLAALATAQAEANQFDDAVMTQWRVVRLVKATRAASQADRSATKQRLADYMAEKKVRAQTTVLQMYWAD